MAEGVHTDGIAASGQDLRRRDAAADGQSVRVVVRIQSIDASQPRQDGSLPRIQVNGTFGGHRINLGLDERCSHERTIAHPLILENYTPRDGSAGPLPSVQINAIPREIKKKGKPTQSGRHPRPVSIHHRQIAHRARARDHRRRDRAHAPHHAPLQKDIAPHHLGAVLSSRPYRSILDQRRARARFVPVRLASLVESVWDLWHVVQRRTPPLEETK